MDENRSEIENINDEKINVEEPEEIKQDETAEESLAEDAPFFAEEAPEKEVYAFKWTYTDQYMHDKDEAPKQKKQKGALGYALVMISVFALAFAILACALVLDDAAAWFKDPPAYSEGYSVKDIVKKGMPSTVAIIGVKGDGKANIGSGFVYNDMGYIITNYHVAENCINLNVVDSTGKDYTASLVNYDQAMDLALLYVENCELPAADIGNSATLELGETVVSIGCPNGDQYMFSPSSGIVSGLNRQISTSVGMIQTTAPLNPGNSGGPLFNDRGEVVGVVTSKLSYTTNEDGEKIPLEGMAFAIPINAALCVENWIEKDLQTPMLGVTAVGVEANNSYYFDGVSGRRYPHINIDGKDYMDTGIEQIEITPEMLKDPNNYIVYADATGVLITDVTRGLGADGVLKRMDIVTEINGVAVTTVQDVKAVFITLKPGDKIDVKFYRDGKLEQAQMTLKTKSDMLEAEK